MLRWGTGLRGSPRRTGPVTSTHVVEAKWGTDMRKSGRSIGTGRTHGTGLAVQSWFSDTLRKEGDFGVDASTPMTGVNDWPRMRHLGQYSPIPEIQPSQSPIRSAQPDLCCAGGRNYRVMFIH